MTYGAGHHLSGVGVYSREIAKALARAHEDARFAWCYRPHRFLRAWASPRPRNCRRWLLGKGPLAAADLFHGLNQRLDRPYRRGIATFHDLFVLTGDYSTSEFRRRFAEQARQAAERADLIITVSEFTARQVEALLNVERARLRVIPHGTRLQAARSDIAREPLILFVGAIQKRKNVQRLVAAFERTPVEWKLALAGSPSGYGAAEIASAIEASSRRRDIALMGYVPDETLERLYARASIFAFPSLDEGFGIPVLEAMARGLPVLTSDRSALPEVAGDAAVLVNPEDTDAIAAGLKELIEDSGRREELARKGLARSAAYTWENAAEATWKAYNELLF